MRCPRFIPPAYSAMLSAHRDRGIIGHHRSGGCRAAIIIGITTTAPMPGTTSTPATASRCSATEFWISLAADDPDARLGSHAASARSATRRPRSPGPAGSRRSSARLVFLYGGWAFLQGAVRELRDRLPGMMTLIALAITVAFVFSARRDARLPRDAALGGAGDAGHDHAARPLDRDALDLPGAGRAQELAKLLPDTAVRLTQRCERNRARGGVPLDALREGDLVLVRPGASIPPTAWSRRARARSTRR